MTLRNEIEKIVHDIIDEYYASVHGEKESVDRICEAVLKMAEGKE